MALSLRKQKTQKCWNNASFKAFFCKLCSSLSPPNSPSSTSQTAMSDICRHCFPVILKRKSRNLNKTASTQRFPLFPSYVIKQSSELFPLTPKRVLVFNSNMCVCVCVCVCVHIDKQFSDISWVSVQLNSDSTYSRSYKTAPRPIPTSDASPKPGLSPVLLTNWL